MNEVGAYIGSNPVLTKWIDNCKPVILFDRFTICPDLVSANSSKAAWNMIIDKLKELV